jgi:hypothetical protein
LFARVDEADWPQLQAYTWHAIVTDKGTYAQTWVRATDVARKHTVRMHVLLMGVKGVDHRDGDGLNNTRANLRLATATENARNRRVNGKNNTTGYKGVIRRPDRPGKFRARIVIAGKAKGLGDFNDPVKAAKAYDAAARRYFGEFARVNFPTESGTDRNSAQPRRIV